jgi:hypothetical protein
MLPNHHIPYEQERVLRPDRRPLPCANEIRMRVKRLLSRQGA